MTRPGRGDASDAADAADGAQGGDGAQGRSLERQLAVADRFRAAWATVPEPVVELLPLRLTTATVAVLPADGAGLSLFDTDFRVPLAASDEEASIAERLQFTLNEGPCLSAARSHLTLAADTRRLQEQWPNYAHELFRRTSYRAVIALPLPLGDATTGALDLYFRDPERLHDITLADSTVVTEQIAKVLKLSQAVSLPDDFDPDAESLPQWLSSTSAQQRRTVWVATGILMNKLSTSAEDSVALLRSHAYSTGEDVDDTARHLVAGDLSPDDLRP